jgi:16S rRNA A1518/A1519 N6-dimethyltransferase RsmA/KsgA/DIM1 with predicted DNA glycosylase/AP lyase activity
MRAHDTPGDDDTREAVFALIDAGFSSRRKMARQALAEFFGGVEEATEAITRAGRRPTDRCEQWQLADFIALHQAGKP